MVDLKQVRLVLFFTQGMSLSSWDSSELFEREVALYRALMPHLGGITFVTYGDKRDLQFAHRLNGIEVVCNHRKLSLPWYKRALAYWPAKWHKGQTVFKSNQVRGSDLALSLAKHHGKPFISRCGYLFGDNMKWREGIDAPITKTAMALEQEVFGGADRVVVTTPAMQSIITADYRIDPAKIRIIPNYVDTDLFCPSPPQQKAPRRLIFIGRLERQKNIESLIQALSGIGVELWIVGQGTLEESLRTIAAQEGVDVRFFGAQPHTKLPELINAATAFILPSHWEGHPKTLLEALSCGLPAIGGDIPSISGVIEHGKNGLLCGLSHEAIREQVIRLLDDPDLQKTLGDNARQYALDNLTIEKTVERELTLLGELTR
jgi:glycosyltransferase involved in cell wall biosynthesis